MGGAETAIDSRFAVLGAWGLLFLFFFLTEPTMWPILWLGKWGVESDAGFVSQLLGTVNSVTLRKLFHLSGPQSLYL